MSTEPINLDALRRQLASVGSGAAEPDLASSPFKDINGALEELRRLDEAYDDLCDGNASPCPHIGVDLAQVLLGEVIRQAAELDRYHALHDWLAGEIENWKALPVERIQEQLAKVNGTTIRRESAAEES